MAVRANDSESRNEDSWLPVQGRRAFDVYDLALLLWRHRVTVLAFVFLGLVIGISIAYLLTPIFRAEATVQIRADPSNGSALQSLAGQLGPLGALAGTLVGQDGDERGVALATLQSRAIVEAYIERNKLLPLLFARKWDPIHERWRRNDRSYVPTAQDGFKKFREKIFSVTDDKRTGLVVVAVEWKDPGLAAKWLNDLVADANAMLKSRTIRESEANLQYLEAQAKSTSIVELRLALYKLMEAEYKKLMIARNAEDYVFRTIDPAVVPEKKVRPRRALIIALACVLGMTIGVTFVLLRTAIKRRLMARPLGESG